jgi:hypothetical protein
MTTQLEDLVKATVLDFMAKDTLFTALDISNSVKESMPLARHREVRDVVRALFATDIEPAGWARDNISVTLEDGSPQTAMLYYPLSASWDLNTQYDDQKRAQVSKKTVPTPAPSCSSVLLGTDGTIKVVAAGTTVSSPATPAPTAPVPAHDAWKNMFAAAPSLFPRQ